ncbi:hypothetical protein [Cellulomonas triticagri]|uniref:PH domain-containing protein n=1 Tax=Cellulomonas triticagri TaxID=2483352 RepID=A0A3M2J5N7_9CELL|nr:hypothetical protein [Cellulomonas triticagri]RMI08719.1 hypothetical protein EBM89_13345 [Cellulomonas triticagri]
MTGTRSRSAPSVVRSVTARPPRWAFLVLGGLLLVLPGRRGGATSVSVEILSAGPWTRQALALYALWLVVGVLLVRGTVRARSRLALGADGALLLDVRGVLVDRSWDLSGAARLVVVRMKQRGQSRYLLLAEDGTVRAALVAHHGLWDRADTQALLRECGVEVRYDTRRPDAHELDTLYPGASLWTDRHPVLLALLVVAVTIAGIATAIAVFAT